MKMNYGFDDLLQKSFLNHHGLQGEFTKTNIMSLDDFTFQKAEDKGSDYVMSGTVIEKKVSSSSLRRAKISLN